MVLQETGKENPLLIDITGMDYSFTLLKKVSYLLFLDCHNLADTFTKCFLAFWKCNTHYTWLAHNQHHLLYISYCEILHSQEPCRKKGLQEMKLSLSSGKEVMSSSVQQYTVI